MTASVIDVPVEASTSLTRIRSIDIVRGVVMVLMAIDHVRVYSGLPAGGTTTGIFLTRWITHFCAPAFVFLAGTAAFMHGRKLSGPVELSRYLVTRGLLLVALELTVIRFGWTFQIGGYGDFTLAGVIWMLGWCMVLLAGLVRFSPKVVGLLGIAIVLLQQPLALVPRLLPEPVQGVFGAFWEFVYPSGFDSLRGVWVLYSLVPWIGVMAAGYGFGVVLLRVPAERRRFCLTLGLSSTLLFLLLAGLVVALNPVADGGPPAWMRLLNQNKYPASQLFLLMTLGPTIALLPFLERTRGWLAGVMITFGRVPMFYYLLHIPLIHVTALLVMLLRNGVVLPDWYATAPFVNVPDASRWSLSLLYLIFLIDVAILYPLCRWYARFKAVRPNGWLRYI